MYRVHPLSSKRFKSGDMTGFPQGAPWYSYKEGRFPVPETENLTEETKDILDEMRTNQDLDGDYSVFLALARLGRIFPYYFDFFDALLSKSPLSGADIETIVIRLSWRKGYSYEYAQHRKLAKQAGLSDKTIQELMQEDLSGLDPKTETLARAVDDLVHSGEITDPVWAKLSEYFTEDQKVAILITEGHYVMIGQMLRTLTVPVEDQTHPGAQVGEN